MRVEKTEGQPPIGIQETLQMIDGFYHFSSVGVSKDRQSEDEVELVYCPRQRQIPNPVRVVLKVIAIVKDKIRFRSRFLSKSYSINGDIKTPVPVMVDGGIRMMQYISNVPSKIEDVFAPPHRVTQLRIEVRKLLNVLRDKRHVALSIIAAGFPTVDGHDPGPELPDKDSL